MDGQTNAKAKYLKYKAKYEELKQKIEAQQGGLITFQTGWHTYLLNEQLFNKVKNQFTGEAPSNQTINELLNLAAIRIKSFTNEATIVSSTLLENVHETIEKLKNWDGSVFVNGPLVDSDLLEEVRQCAKTAETKQVQRNKIKMEDVKLITTKINIGSYFMGNNEKELINKFGTSGESAKYSFIRSEANRVLNQVPQNIKQLISRNTGRLLGRSSVDNNGNLINEYPDLNMNYILIININRIGRNKVMERLPLVAK